MILMGGDEVVVTKSGKQTHGSIAFFPLCMAKRPGLCFLSVS